ncbi:LAFE_0E03312g1_1 [Lachancea fermentati]|uniref:LAFE_0E03312g1_1 n=1 Tax=Lachancea fermentati TaxID=4955 RepID=A0A1G4MCL5_LACFM|nr:LAFE_0E03312g1_1 [Lachancea fermentati]
MIRRSCGLLNASSRRLYRCGNSRHNQAVKDADHFKDEEVSSMQERTLFEQIFMQIMKKDEEKRNSKNLLGSITSGSPSEKPKNDGVQIVFGKKQLSVENEKLQKFLKDATGEKTDDVGEFARITTDDIRKYPVSLTSTYFTNASHEINDNQAPEFLGISSLKDIFLSSKKSASEEGKATFSQAESKERLQTALREALQPHIKYLNDRIETDFDCLEVIEGYLEAYENRDKSLEKQSKTILAQISNDCVKHPTTLPQPYSVTLPYIIKYLFTEANFNFPSDREYTLISHIYHRAKRSQNISLYLNVCNVDFYNSLLKCCWENYQEIHQTRQLVTEMSVNGIMGDNSTIALLDKIVREMRFLNDGILDETDFNTDTSILGAAWCRENSQDLDYVENFLVKLKQNQN